MNTKFKIGEKVVYKSKVYNVSRIIINQYTICYQIDNGRCIGYEEYTGILERELKKYESILDTAEKRYLKNVIRPFKDRVKYVDKLEAYWVDNGEFIFISLGDDIHEHISLPWFHKGSMYKNMELGKEYSLKELGL